MKKILEVVGEPISFGGQEAFIFNVLRNINMEGLSIDFFTPYYCDNPSAEELIHSRGGRLFSAGIPFAPGKSRSNIVKPLQDVLRRTAYDVVHIHSGSISVLALDARTAAQCHVPNIIVHSHASGEKENIRHRLIKSVMNPLLDRYPTSYLACSEMAGRWKFSRRVCDGGRLQILRNGIELSSYAYQPEVREAYRAKLGIGHDAFVLIHVGRFSYEKNQTFAVEVFRQVRKKNPDSFLLLLGAGETEQTIRSQVRKEGLENAVIFTGNVTNVRDYLQAADVFVFPSRFEGLGIVGVEAQASGLPVIASNQVPKELNLTGHVEFLPLDRPEYWAERICSHRGDKRYQAIDTLREKGYDIRQTCEEIRRLYLR
ncbi:MAG: glycosyltransferase [Bilifractor sp.]